MDPKFATKLDELERRLLDQHGALDPGIRRAAEHGDALPAALEAYVDKVRRHAYRVTDQEVADLLAQGWSEDQLFELTVVAAYGASRRRLDAGLGALAIHAIEPDAARAAEP